MIFMENPFYCIYKFKIKWNRNIEDLIPDLMNKNGRKGIYSLKHTDFF